MGELLVGCGHVVLLDHCPFYAFCRLTSQAYCTGFYLGGGWSPGYCLVMHYIVHFVLFVRSLPWFVWLVCCVLTFLAIRIISWRVVFVGQVYDFVCAVKSLFGFVLVRELSS